MIKKDQNRTLLPIIGIFGNSDFCPKDLRNTRIIDYREFLTLPAVVVGRFWSLTARWRGVGEAH